MRFFLVCCLALLSTQGISKEPVRYVFKESPTIHPGDVPEKDISVTAEAQPSTFVGHVNTVFGNFLFPTVDLTFDGPVQLPVVRYYNSESSTPSWMCALGMTSNYPIGIKGYIPSDRAIELMKKAYHNAPSPKNLIPKKQESAALLVKSNEEDAFVYAVAEEDGGSQICCSAKPHIKDMIFYLDPETIHKGLTNAGRGEISARTNLKNTKFHAKGRLKENVEGYFLETEWDMTTCDGKERNYYKTDRFDAGIYIRQERETTGNKLLFEYTDNKIMGSILKEIRATNSSHRHAFGRLKVTCNEKHKKVNVEASNGKKITYKYSVHSTKHCPCCPLMDEVSASDHPDIRYYYTHGHDEAFLLSHIRYPEGRYLKISYDDKDRVKEQKAPVGPNNKEVTLFRFKYHPHDYKTNVFDANNNESIYRYSSKKRLKSIERLDNKEKTLREEKFFWGEKTHLSRGERDDSDEGNLLAKAVKQKGKALVCTCYTYGGHGNITEERLYGNLTGEGIKEFSLNDEGKPEKGVESYKKYASFYQDQFHMIKEKSEDAGPTLSFEYQKDTNLLTARFTKEGDRIRRREFFEYDNDAVLVKKIIDDGSSSHEKNLSGVTERHITHITPVRDREDYGIGQPSEVRECYYDLTADRERQLKRITYSYNKAGRATKETVFDARDKESYYIKYAYDSYGNVTEKTHSGGKKYLYSYDKNCNKISEELVGSGMRKEFIYDKANRIVKEVSYHDNGPTFTTSFTYDNASNKISVTDPFGQETRFEYDGLNRIRAIFYPSVLDDKDATLSPVEYKEYNALNCLTKKTDCNGHVTTYECTARGQPCCVVYPDGSSEKNIYNTNGTLAKAWDRTGMFSTYEYDFLNRLKKTVVNGEKITTHTFSSFHETSSTDPLGVTTKYYYDGAGRLVEEEKEDKKVQYEYDSLGRRSSTKRYASDSSWIGTFLVYDVFDRIIEERSQHSDGTLLSLQRYEYDLLDNRIKTQTYTSPEVFSTDFVEYNSQSLPVRHVDALGNTTTYRYDYTWKNELGQSVLKKETIDPLGNKTIEIFDAFQRLDTVEKRSFFDSVLQKTVFRYDAKGNKLQERRFVYADGVYMRTYLSEWTYNESDLTATCSEQPGTPDEKLTSYSYFPGGLIKAITKPNGIVLDHAYDSFARLRSMHASDNSVDYTYEYDLNDNVLSVTDGKLLLSHAKSYDVHNRIIKDSLGTGIDCTFSYDALDRVTEASFGPLLTANYRYRSGRLFEIVRKGPAYQDRYVHRYDAFDLAGHVTRSSLIKSCGTLQYAWDPLQRLERVSSQYFEEKCALFDKAGNLLEIFQRDPEGSITSTFTYDDLYQLIEEKGFFENSYTNDSLHNRLKKDADAYDINPLNQLLSAQNTLFTYDKNGNPTEIRSEGRTLLLSYDGLDRLLAVEEPFLARSEYGYDASHRRLFTKTFSWIDGVWQEQETIRFLYFNRREVGSLLPDNTVKDFRVLGLGKGAELGASISLELGGKIFCPLHDHRGNIAVLIDTETKIPSATYRYSAFGEERLFGLEKSPWRFSSKRIDQETGFVFFGQRYYSPQFGRFLTPDPLGFTDGPNMYAYVKNNPLLLLDPYGLMEESPPHSGFWGVLRDGYVRASTATFLSDTLKNISYEETPGSEVPAHRESDIFASGIISHPHNEFALTGEFQLKPVRVEWLINGDNFYTRYKNTKLKSSVALNCNGMLTDFAEAQGDSQMIKDIGGDDCVDMLVCHNPSDGLFADLIESGLQMAGISTYADRQLQQKLIDVHTRCEQAGISMRLGRFSHSQGVLTTRNMYNAPEFQEGGRFSKNVGKWATFGGPVQPAGATNYVALGDLIPFIFSGTTPLLNLSHMQLCGTLQNPFAAHRFAGPSYREALADSIHNKGMFDE